MLNCSVVFVSSAVEELTEVRIAELMAMRR